MVPQPQVRPKISPVENSPPTLWQQLDPLTRRQLTQQWATMLQKMRQMAQPKDNNHDPD
jgi:hypothetical protein